MGIGEEIRAEVQKTLRSNWQTRAGQKVPEDSDVRLDNDGVELDATVLYADLADSTGLVQRHPAKFVAEVYKCYLRSACRIIRGNDGAITAFDGDRVMAVFVGPGRSTRAAKTALQIRWTVRNVINPEIQTAYASARYEVQHGVGIDAGHLLVAKTGVRGNNDLAWAGLPANRAAKLSAVRSPSHASWITQAAFNELDDSVKFGGTPRQSMWTPTSSPLGDAASCLFSDWEWQL